MKTITVRGIDAPLAEKLKRTAKDEGKSVNQLVLDSIKDRLGENEGKKFTRVYHDMDHLFGKWTQAEFEAIQGKIDAERKIDRELWT
jgi:ribosomal protein S24E